MPGRIVNYLREAQTSSLCKDLTCIHFMWQTFPEKSIFLHCNGLHLRFPVMPLFLLLCVLGCEIPSEILLRPGSLTNLVGLYVLSLSLNF